MAEPFSVNERSLYRYLAIGMLTRYKRGGDARVFVEQRQLLRVLQLRAV